MRPFLLLTLALLAAVLPLASAQEEDDVAAVDDAAAGHGSVDDGAGAEAGDAGDDLEDFDEDASFDEAEEITPEQLSPEQRALVRVARPPRRDRRLTYPRSPRRRSARSPRRSERSSARALTLRSFAPPPLLRLPPVRSKRGCSSRWFATLSRWPRQSARQSCARCSP